MNRLLTIGMPTFDDWDGVFFSLQSLRLHHKEVAGDVEFLLIDNNPSSPQGRTCKRLLSQIPNARYVPEVDWKGPWVKDLVMRKAETPYALCMDSHVLLEQGSLARLVEFFRSLDNETPAPVPGERQPSRDDLYHGPLIYDNLQAVSTHFELVWRGEMWGIWATDDRGKQAGNPPFEIPAQGMGLFACHTDAWEKAGGFSRLMRGFGGEEGYIHAKFRKAGSTVWCLPFLRWLHRFDRPGGVKYVLTWENKVRNYFLAFLENDMDVMPIIRHFETKHPRQKIDALLEQTAREFHMHNMQRRNRRKIPAAEE